MSEEHNTAIIPTPTGDDLSDLMKLGKVLAASGFFRDATSEAKAFVKVLAGQEIGIPPIAAMTGIHIITTENSTNISIGANIMAGLVKRSPRYDYRIAHLDFQKCILQFFENGQDVGESTYTIEEARHAGLVKTRSNWDKYPKNMLFARAVSNGTRLYCPDLLGGAPVYTPDELGVQVDEHGNAVVEGEVVSVDGEPPPSPQAAPRPPQRAERPSATAWKYALGIPIEAPNAAARAASEPQGDGKDYPALLALADDMTQLGHFYGSAFKHFELYRPAAIEAVGMSAEAILADIPGAWKKLLLVKLGPPPEAEKETE